MGRHDIDEMGVSISWELYILYATSHIQKSMYAESYHIPLIKIKLVVYTAPGFAS